MPLTADEALADKPKKAKGSSPPPGAPSDAPRLDNAAAVDLAEILPGEDVELEADAPVDEQVTVTPAPTYTEVRDHIFASVVELYEKRNIKITPRELQVMNVALIACGHAKASWWRQFKKS